MTLEERLQALAEEEGIDPLFVHDAPQKTAYAVFCVIFPRLYSHVDHEDDCQTIRFLRGIVSEYSDAEIEVNIRKGYRLFDPHQQVLGPPKVDSDGYTCWSFESE